MMLHLLQIDLTAKSKTKQNEIFSPKRKMKSFGKGGEKKTAQFNTVANLSEFYKLKFRYFPNQRVHDVPHTVELEGDCALGGLF
jgi:hypothetical protein